MTVRIMVGDAAVQLRTLDAGSIQCCVTSPPYFGLRDYGHAGQMGMESTPDAYVQGMVSVFREVKRVLRDDGTLWLNIGDSYATSGTRQGNVGGGIRSQVECDDHRTGYRSTPKGLKNKDLIGIPWMLAFALRADGWYLRQRLPWVKRNPMPESVTDRPTSGVEEIFLLSKSERYFYDYEAVKRHMASASLPRLAQDLDAQAGSSRANGGAKTNGPMKAVRGDKQRGHSRRHAGFNDRWDAMPKNEQCGERAFRNTDLFYDSLDAPHGAIGNESEIIALDVATQPFAGAHFATFPPALIQPLILAGSRIGDTIVDPFGGAGTTGLVADRLSRHALLIEINPEYAALAERRIHDDSPLFVEIAAP